MESLEAYLQRQGQRVEDALDQCLPPRDSYPPVLMEAMRYSVFAGGKRLRPILLLAATEAVGGESDLALPAACAVECIHTYSMIHDDLPAMDDDDLRRGRPTNHKVFGEALAILAGDALLTLAFDVLARHITPPEAAAGCCAALARAAGAAALVGGQVSDLEQEGKIDAARVPVDTDHGAANVQGITTHEKPSAAFDRLVAIHARKTAALLVAALEMGGICGGGTKSQLSALVRYGHCIGLAFQIRDDLLDVDGDERALGKRVGKDAPRGKLTYPQCLGVEESRRRAGALIDEAIDSITPLGDTATGLAQLARYVVERDR